MANPVVLWSPPPDVRERTRVGRYLAWLGAERGLRFDGYDALWRWSVADPDAFWRSVWDCFGVGEPVPAGRGLADARMPGARWFPDQRVNWAEHALRLAGRRADDVVIAARSESRERVTLTAAGLRDAVARARAGLLRLGVQRGERVAAYLPNVPEAAIAHL
ncbi:MAG TPA: acetyl-coenzyme A synthetase N-terminal domain-containing protein, partial [Candidatus Limnocylindria bacterium]